ncbi:hypothetical protein ACFYZ4_06845 [Streptomyces sp. NPDC001513]|uniref:hypothetical protein n=1 Tax=Streptomyces sp. NPDC001513 TaxID=3364580 RepID=UPI00368DCEE8
MPEVVGILETPYAYDALRVLGRIGPAAAGTADRLAAYATGRDPRTARNHPRRAAWAHWKVTGDPAFALDVCGAAPCSASGRSAPLLRGILAAEKRLGQPLAGRRILADGLYVRTLAEALARIDP